ncbi:AAA domain-containing protein [Rickettsia endosymbiont of Gonocerus acuteangulatus]|uniref:AAA domain-containing protein n=1 Tax=Rickettsia endosymbiont of Gonocerus acuteangulatus TaxID=3066266 RepID=UPI0031332F9E
MLYKLKIENQVDGFCINNIGTIHAFQGKENDTVIMMLGAQHPEDKGARGIMTSKPNVLNVGISRAKNNLYVIGNAEFWLKPKYMQEIYNILDIFNQSKCRYLVIRRLAYLYNALLYG